MYSPVVDVGVVSLPMSGANDELVVRPANISSDGAACTGVVTRCKQYVSVAVQSSTTRGQ